MRTWLAQGPRIYYGFERVKYPHRRVTKLPWWYLRLRMQRAVEWVQQRRLALVDGNTSADIVTADAKRDLGTW